LALGCLILTRENSVVLMPVLIIWVIVRGGRAVVPMLAFLTGLAVVVVPVGIRNFAVGGEFHLTTSQFGPNLFIGNHENATGTYVALRSGRGTAAFERQDATELAQTALGRRLTPGEVSHYWSDRAYRWMRENPGRALTLFGRKLLLVWNAQEAVDTEDLDTHGEWSVVLRWPSVFLHFGILAPLGLLGMWLTCQRWQDLWPYYAICLAYSLSVAAFYVLARYRYPLVPVLILFAGPAVEWVLGGWRHSSLATRLAAALGLGALTLLVNWPLVPAAAMRAATHFNLGHEFQTNGRPDAAIAEYRTVLTLWPQHARAHSNLGVLLAARNQHDEAAAHYQEAVRIDPGLTDAQVNLGIELARRESFDEAIQVLTRAVALEPANAVAHYNLGVAFARAGDLKQAVRHLEQAVASSPGYFEAHNNLAVLLVSSGQYEPAITHFEAAAKLRPDDPGAKANLERARVLLRQNR
jgi:tetratricopeptide (TPR) repeat protein